MAGVVRIEYRPMVPSDVDSVPIAHQGDRAEVLARMGDIGSTAVLAFDGGRHVGQLQFRRYEAGTRTPNGVWDPLYWMDFDNYAPDLPPDTLCLFCYHVGQLDDTAGRDERYQGLGIGATLLDCLLEWARAANFEAVIAKALPPLRPVMEFLGGLPEPVYKARGFGTVARWFDADLARIVHDRELITERDLPDASTVACCVLQLRG